MNLFLHYSPFWLKAIFPSYIWHVHTSEKVIYLTFDDGPIPVVTEFVLKTLGDFGAKATFFCIGDNVRKHPDIFQQIIDGHHSIGNHTFHHKNGWKTDVPEYIDNFHLCQAQLGITTQLFRPPYGRIRKAQVRLLPPLTRVIMWDVLSGDFSKQITPETCLQQSIRHTRNGSIVLFHDSLKANDNMSYALPRFLNHFAELGYRFDALPMQ